MLRRLLHRAVQAAEQASAALSTSASHLESTLQHQLGRSCSAATIDGRPVAVWRQQSCGPSFAAQRHLTHFSDGLTSSSGRACPDAAQGVSALRLPWSLSHTPRGLFGAARPLVNPQIHTHDKYKKENSQPANSFLLGRFVTDRNGIIWHRQANYRHARHAKSASQLTRLKRWKPLAPAFAAKLRKLGFNERYWAAPDPQDVPGFHSPRGRVERPRRSAVPDMDHTTGEPALRQSWQPPNRQRLR